MDVIGTTDGTSPFGWYPEHPKGSYKLVTQDGTAHTRLLGKPAIDLLGRAVATGRERHPSNLVYEIKKAPRVAVIGVGGGVDVANALHRGATKVTGLELNPAIAEYTSETYAEFNGHLLQDPRVRFLNMEGRSFMRSTDERFDVLQVIAIDTFAALSSGAYVLSENYLYTVEAFRDYYDHIADGGVVSFYRWAFPEPREELRVCMLAAAAWKESGAKRVDQSMFVIGDGKWALTLFRKGAFTPQEVSTLGARAKELHLTVFYWPKVLENQVAFEQDYFRTVSPAALRQHAAFDEAITAYEAGKQDEFFEGYRYQVHPTTDDSPFFFEYNRLGAFGLPNLADLRGDGASTTLLILVAQTTLLSILAIFLPLWRMQRRGLTVAGAGWWSAYFAAIGFGFMLVEIVLMQKGVLFLGSPLHSISAVLSSLLVAAGLGSLLQSRFPALGAERRLAVVGISLIVLIITYGVGLSTLFRALLHLPFVLRLVVLVLVVAPAGLLMGMFFPSGLSRVGSRAADFVPWAWGINGCMSVYGSVIAILVALSHGFGVALWIGAGCYLVAVVSFALGSRALTRLAAAASLPP